MAEHNENIEKTVLIFENVQVYIESFKETYEYYMTNDFNAVNDFLKKHNLRELRQTDMRLNSSLAQSVKDKMAELNCCYSITFSHGNQILNYWNWTKNSKMGYIVYLNELRKSFKSYNVYEVLKNLFVLKSSLRKTSKLASNVEQSSFNQLMLSVMLDSPMGAIDAIKHGACVNCFDERGATPLMLAVFNKNVPMIELLIKEGADVNYCTNNGISPIMFAITHNIKDSYTEIIKILRAEGANLDNVCINTQIPQKKLTFKETLEYFISQFTLNGRGKTSLIYKNTSIGGVGGIDKRTFSKIRNTKNPNYHPKKNNVFLLAIGMKLTVEQTEQLLSSAGYAFDEKDKFDMIIKDFIQKRDFRIEEIENSLHEKTGKYLGKFTEPQIED